MATASISNKTTYLLQTFKFIVITLVSVLLIACGSGGEVSEPSSASEQVIDENPIDSGNDSTGEDASDNDSTGEDTAGNGSTGEGTSENTGSGNEESEEPVQVSLPVISNHPEAVSIDEGNSTTLSVSTSAGAVLSFQWRKNEVEINGATSNTLIIESAVSVDAGVYDVVISNDAGSVTSLSALVTVIEQPASQTVSLSWDIPESREDGSDLDLYEIDGYVIVYGTEENNLDSQLVVSGATETTAEVDALLAGTYYFAIATLDSDGKQGAYSETIAKII